MSERCQVCGREITGIASNFNEHVGKIGFWTSMDYGKNMRAMGGRCGSCGKICCKDCYRNGMCPSCESRIRSHGSSHL
ncbi:MAG: hypothetical protein JW724_04670 [Candidatus Altiarchaeota archaeon]|nr:hypothetical protein [Candidatus Altiarchaeota archaeon]